MAVLGAITFLVAYLLVAPVAGALSNGDIPLPDDPADELVAFYKANGNTWIIGVLQTISVLGFAVFVAVIRPILQRAYSAQTARRLTALAAFSVVAMVVSSVLGALLPILAENAEAGTVADVRMASFWAGGVATVIPAGVYVLMAARALHRAGRIGRGVERLGIVAGVLSILSITSLAFYYANAFIPFGRILAMVWTVVVAVRLYRKARAKV